MHSSAWARRGGVWLAGAVLLLGGASAQAEQAADRAVWDGLLHKHVKNGLVDYQGVKRDEAQLDTYLASLAAPLPSSATKEERMAFWINAYNANVFKSVLANMPLKSVKDVKGFFDKIQHSVGGEPLVLNAMEANARAFGDWRTHAAVNCASASCPPLRDEAYAPERLDQQLAEQATRWLADPQRGLRLEGKMLWGSKIFKWYAKDFVPSGQVSTATLLPVLERSLDRSFAQQIRQDNPALKFMEYD